MKDTFELAEILQDEMLRLRELAPNKSDDALYFAAIENLGNEDGRFDGFYTCLYCGSVYDQDYSHNTDPDRDFCDTECEYGWLRENPDARYEGDLYNDVSLFPARKIRKRGDSIWQKRRVMRVCVRKVGGR